MKPNIEKQRDRFSEYMERCLIVLTAVKLLLRFDLKSWILIGVDYEQERDLARLKTNLDIKSCEPVMTSCEVLGYGSMVVNKQLLSQVGLALWSQNEDWQDQMELVEIENQHYGVPKIQHDNRELRISLGVFLIGGLISLGFILGVLFDQIANLL